ncbi:MAG: PD-(D/E)XK nuclease family protein [Clostridia bacterium]|nr:PD-(D/E)XK nuclease family protein [Clostridia bacterium]
MYELTLPIRHMVEFLMRSGSIDARAVGGFDRAQEGSRIHRRLQKEAGEGYRAEVALSRTVECGDFRYTLQGRADGIFQQDGVTVIDEIKTTQLPAEHITEDRFPAHWAQAACYAWIVTAEEGAERANIRLTYVQTDTGTILHFIRSYTAAELETQVMGLLTRYERWARLDAEWHLRRNESLTTLTFPFGAYRAGQRTMAAAVYRTVAAKQRLFCCAPTGIGKTMSVLFPALKAMGGGMGEKIFYLTAKTVTGQAAEDALARLKQHHPELCLRSVMLTAKDKLCMLPERNCTPEHCPYADGYFDRANDAVYDLLVQGMPIRREVLLQAAERYRLCPYELALDLSTWADCIICDYNYLLDPVVHLQRFFESRGDYIFLMDEAHNGIDRCREMFSATLRKSDVLALRKIIPKKYKSLRNALSGLNNVLLNLRKSCEEAGDTCIVQKDLPAELLSPVQKFVTAVTDWLEDHRGETTETEKEILTLFFDVRFFGRIAERYDETYTTLLMRDGSDLTVRLLCLDPSPQVNEALAKGRASILFSATLSPMDYYRSVLGGAENAYTLGLDSPFDPAKLGLFVADTVSTRYVHREESADTVVRLLYDMAAARPGHYIAYFPSYAYMMQIYERFRTQYPEIPTVVQARGMDEEAREAFLTQFRTGDGALLGFCVLGGIFAEGVDLAGDRLIGTAVVGVGLPQIGPEPDALRDYYDAQNGSGFDYAYRFPGMNKVLQAAGRVIRTENGRGVVLLIDDRFRTPAYRALFPVHWQGAVAVTPDTLPGLLAEFWRET